MSEEDRRLILCGVFPHYPYLPMKRYKEGVGEPEVGFILAFNKTKLYKFNLFIYLRNKMTLEGIEFIEYDTIEEMLEDGWMVD